MRGFRLQEDFLYDTDQNGQPVIGHYQSQDAYRLTYLRAQTQLVLRLAGPGNGWLLLLGGYAGTGIRGRYRYQYTNQWGTYERAAAGQRRLRYGYTSGSGGGFGMFSGGSSADIRPLDAGVQVGGGYQWGRLQAQARYEASLTPLLPGYLERQLGQQQFLRSTTLSLAWYLSAPLANPL